MRVLIVEDQPADAELCLYELKKVGFRPQADIARDLDEFERCLKMQTYDVILCDHNLGMNSGMDCLNALKQAGHSTPFILVSGSVGEEAAVEYVHQGASDFILKDRLVRLSVAIRRAVEEKVLREERRRAEATLRLQTKALETTANAVVITDREGRITWVNPAFTRLTGYAAAEVLGQTPRFLKSGKHEAAFYRSMWE
ncbi:MAG: response regulator, partial [Candidatus Acidiferrales bacterium]